MTEENQQLNQVNAPQENIKEISNRMEKVCLLMQVSQVNESIEKEKQQSLELAQKQSSSSSSGDKSKVKDNWSDNELQTLIKAVNLFPAGTNARYTALISLVSF